MVALVCCRMERCFLLTTHDSASAPTAGLRPDASGSWGCGAYYDSHWFQLRWDRRSEGLPIMVKELLPVVLACTVWGQEWACSCVRCLCDNQAVVACLRSRTSRDKHCMHMLRTLAFVEARHMFSLRPQYISTTDNHLADDLSRDKFASFLAKVPMQTPGKRPSPPSWWICYWTPRWTGPRRAGSSSSAIFSRRPRSLYPTGVWFGNEEVHRVLCKVQCLRPLSRH